MAAQSKTPVRTEKGAIETTRSSGAEVDAFLTRVKSMTPTTVSGRGRLIFAMDATMSRQPAWDLALKLQVGATAARRRGFRHQRLEIGKVVVACAERRAVHRGLIE